MIKHEKLAESKRGIWSMFNRISGRYDRVNRLMTFGLDQCWRKLMAKQLPNRVHMQVLDLATGTGDVAIQLLRYKEDDISRIIAMDMAEEMMAVGVLKVRALGLSDKVVFQVGDAHALPLKDVSMDAVTVAFGVRNFENLQKGLSEIKRVLKPGGRIIVLETAMPRFFIIRFFHLLYLRLVMPVIGALVSGNWSAYRYLNKTAESFPCGAAFMRELAIAGFKPLTCKGLGLGAAALYVGETE
ncbi:MAG: ubiquinone/menaquinone biosynthesis methyltransferase [bacterium]|nr:ubiquinone/menaquinone biosynthesis methyltransferase [bacterium]